MTKRGKTRGGTRKPAKPVRATEKGARARSSRSAAAKRKPQLKYETASIMTQIAFDLIQPRKVTSVDELLARFGFEAGSATHRRKVQRYLKGLRVGVFNGVFHPGLLRLEDREDSEVPVDEEDLAKIPETRIDHVRMTRAEDGEEEGAASAGLLPLYLAFTVLRYLEGMIPQEQVLSIWQDLLRRLPPESGLLVSNFEHKFYSVPYTPKDYSDCQDILGDVIDALIRQHRLRIVYYGLKGEDHTHLFDPYTLALYKGGLYLVGKSDRHRDDTIYLTIERIDTVEKALDEHGEPIRFRIPADYTPSRHFQGMFGIIQGDETEVELEIQTEETERRLKERMIHPTQEFLPPRPGTPPAPDGYRKSRLRMRVRGTTELAMWILSYGPWLRVLGPAGLRDEIRDRLTEMRALYPG